MKHFIMFFFTLFSISCICQDLPVKKYNIRSAILPAGVAFFSGATWGLHETISHHWGAFHQRFPKASARYWNPAISWKNKYKDGDFLRGEKFPGSSTIFVSTTDAKHLLTSLHRTSMFGAGLTITLGEKRPWWHYAINTGISFFSFSTGFHTVYTVAFN